MSAADLTRSVWDLNAQSFPSSGDSEDKARFLLRYAILAPSSHNSQPWQFRVTGNEIIVCINESRWLRIADPEKRELYISLGCSIENLCVAAEHFGFSPEISYHNSDDTECVATVTLREENGSSNYLSGDLFDGITARYTSHEPFENRTLGENICRQLRSQVVEDEISMTVVNDSETKDLISKLQTQADQKLMAEQAYRKELGHWIGIGALGNSRLMARVAQAFVTYFDIGEREAAKNTKIIDSAPAIGVLTAGSDSPENQVKTGQVFGRVVLFARSVNIGVQPMSQILERPELRSKLKGLLPDEGGRPQHLFCLGYTDGSIHHTPRWPLENVIKQ